ncbi:hypothetical protein [Rhodococcus sp. JG-3]|nr:hypothetical protein [Rhodococcus sp. JG-3]
MKQLSKRYPAEQIFSAQSSPRIIYSVYLFADVSLPRLRAA